MTPLYIAVAVFFAIVIVWRTVYLIRTHVVTIVWVSGVKTRHRTTNLIVERNRYSGETVGLRSEYLSPPITSVDVSQVVAVIRGRA